MFQKLAICISIFFLLFSPFAFAETQKSWTIPEKMNVRVLRDDGTPAVGATVKLTARNTDEQRDDHENEVNLSTVIDDSGNAVFSLEELREHKPIVIILEIELEKFLPVDLSIYHPSFFDNYFDPEDEHYSENMAAVEKQLRVIPPQLTVKLVPADSISGQVLNEDGEPIEGVECFMQVLRHDKVVAAQIEMDVPPYSNTCDAWCFSRQAVTDASGNWTLNNVPPGIDENAIRLSLAHPDYIWDIDLFKEEARETEIYPSYKHRVLKRGKSVSGRITDSEGNPIEGAEVSTYNREMRDGGIIGVYKKSTQSDKDGYYHLKGLMNLISPIEVTAPKKIYQRREVGPLEKEQLESINFALQPGKTIRFRIVDLRGEPIPKMQVLCRAGCGDGVLTDSEGRCVMDDVSEEWTRYTFQSPEARYFMRPVIDPCTGNPIEPDVEYVPREEEYVVELIRWSEEDEDD